MMDDKTVSVIIPVFNVKDYLSECLDSVCGQTCSDIEIIVIDDGSTDGSSEICERYRKKDERIIYLRKDNGGAAAARNIGIDSAGGRWITFCDSDDMLSPVYIEKLRCAAESSEADIVSCGYTTDLSLREVQTDGNQECNDANGVEQTGSAQRSSFVNTGIEALKQNLVRQTLWGKLYRKSVFDDIRIPNLSVHEDVAVIYRLYYKASKVVDIPDILYYNRIRLGSLSEHGLVLGVQLGRLPVLKDKMGFFKEKGQTTLYQMAVKEYVINLLTFIEQADKAGDKEMKRKLKGSFDEIYPEIISMPGSSAFHFSLRAAKISPRLWTAMNRLRK